MGKLVIRWLFAIIASIIVLLVVLHSGSIWISYREYGYIGQFFISCASYFFGCGLSTALGVYISKCDYKKGLVFATIDWLIVIGLLLFFQIFISNSTINMILYFCYFVSSVIGGIAAITTYKQDEVE